MRRWIYMTAIIILSNQAGAQLQFANLREALRYADNNSTVARQGTIQRAISEQDAGIVRAGILPKLNLFSTSEYAPILASQVIPESAFGGQDGKFRTVQFGMPWNFSSGVELTMPVVNFEKWAQLEKARLQSEETEWNQKTKMENLHIQITQWYYQALVAKQMIQLNTDNLEVVNELLRIMTERKNTGILDPADYNRSKNLQLNVETLQQDYIKLLEQSVNNLRSLLNVSPGIAISINDSITGFAWPLQDYKSTDISIRPAWKESIARVEVAKQNLEETRKAAFPKLSLSSRYLYNWQMNKTQNIHFDVNTIGLRLDYTLFNGGYHRRQKSRADLLLQSATIHQEQTQSALIQQQQDWWQNYITASSKTKILATKVSTTTENLRIARLNLAEGVMEFDAFHDIFYEYGRARMEALQNLSDGIIYYLLLTNNIQ